MTKVRRYLVLAGFVSGLRAHVWIQPGQTYKGTPASNILPADIPWVRLVHPIDPDHTVLVPTTYLAELAPEAGNHSE